MNTEFEAKAAAFLLVEVYGTHLLWCFTVEMTRNSSRLDLFQVLWSRAKVEELERLLSIIDLSNFVTLQDDCSRYGEGLSSCLMLVAMRRPTCLQLSQ